MSLIRPEAVIKQREYEVARTNKILQSIKQDRERDRQNVQPFLRGVLLSKLPEVVEMVKQNIVDNTTWSLELRSRRVIIDAFPWVGMLNNDAESCRMVREAVFAEASPEDRINAVLCHITVHGTIIVTFR